MSRLKTLRWLDQRVAALEVQQARRARVRADRARRQMFTRRAGAAVMPTDDVVESIAQDIRRGGTPWVAAAAHGVMPETFARWMCDGSTSAFAQRVMMAQADALQDATRPTLPRVWALPATQDVEDDDDG